MAGVSRATAEQATASEQVSQAVTDMRRQAEQLRRSMKEQVRAQRDMSGSVHLLRESASAQEKGLADQMKSLDQVVEILERMERNTSLEGHEIGHETMLESDSP